MANISADGAVAWLRLLCRFQAQYGVSFVPSAEEISIMLHSGEAWPDLVQCNPETVDYVVMSDSTLVWGGRKRDGLLKSWRNNVTYYVRSGAKALDYAGFCESHRDKTAPVIVIWSLNGLVVERGEEWFAMDSTPASSQTQHRKASTRTEESSTSDRARRSSCLDVELTAHMGLPRECRATCAGSGGHTFGGW